MHEIGEKIIYGINGVMEIVDVREEVIGDFARKYYVLSDLNSASASQIFVPVDNDKLVSSMRPLLSREEAMDMINRIKTIPAAEWKRDSRIRMEKFRKVIESGDREGVIAIIKAVYENGLKRKEEGKKNFLADENLMRKAEKLIYSELSLVLGIPEGEIAEFIGRSEKNEK